MIKSINLLVKNQSKRLTVWHYCSSPEKCYHADIGKYDTYGIKVTGPDYTKTVHDVSVCKEVVDSMAKLFNSYQLSPIHLRCAVEDLLP